MRPCRLEITPVEHELVHGLLVRLCLGLLQGVSGHQGEQRLLCSLVSPVCLRGLRVTPTLLLMLLVSNHRRYCRSLDPAVGALRPSLGLVTRGILVGLRQGHRQGG